MEPNFLNLPFSTKVAIVSFVLGTLLFLGYFVIDDEFLIMLYGFFYVIIAIIINLLLLIYLLYKWLENPLAKKEISNQVLILLVNIPIAILYFVIIFYT